MGIGARLRRAWNVFAGRDPAYGPGGGDYARPDRVRYSRGNERSIVTSVYNRIALDANGNRKLLKKRRDQKIDAVAAMMDAYVAYKLNKDKF
jgi:hypothetical protein